jgi:uncharacterized protein YbjT (DUF2867 family)
MTTLVTGATGHIGRLVVDRLVEAGEDVRALTRDPARAAFPAGVTVVRGDLAEPGTLADAFRGVERLHLFPFPATARAVVGLARRAGVRRIVVLSSGAVTGGADTDFHRLVERAAEESGLEWTHVRAGEFALNMLWLWGPLIRAERVVYEPFPDNGRYPTHEADIADVAATVLLEDGHAGAAYDVIGPELIGHRGQIQKIAAAIGEDIRLVVVEPAEARERSLRQGGLAAANARFFLGLDDGDEPLTVLPYAPPTAITPPTAEDVTGRPGRSFTQWVHDHADDFR